MDPVLDQSAVEQSQVRSGEGTPRREHRPPTSLTYDTFGTPSFYQPAEPGLLSHNAGVAPITVPLTPASGSYRTFELLEYSNVFMYTSSKLV